MFYANKFLTAGADGTEVMGGPWKPVPDIDEISPVRRISRGRAGPFPQLWEKGGPLHAGRKKNPKFIGGGRTYLPSLAEGGPSEGKCDFIFMGHGL